MQAASARLQQLLCGQGGGWNIAHVRMACPQPPGAPLQASLRVPGSKSLSNRALLLAAAAHGDSHVRGLLHSDDVVCCLRLLQQLGVVLQAEQDVLRVQGVGAATPGMPLAWPRAPARLDAGQAGTLARFVPGLLVCSQLGPTILDGAAQLRRRPLAPLLQAWQQLGAQIRALQQPAALPLKIAGLSHAAWQQLQAAQPALQIAADTSSQYLSGLLLAGPLLPQGVALRCASPLVQPGYVTLTLAMMRAFAAEVVQPNAEQYLVSPGGYRGCTLELEADASTAGYFWALAASVGGRVRVVNVTRQSLQPDLALLQCLERMGCTVCDDGQGIEVRSSGQVRGGFCLDMAAFSDQTPTVAALACLADAPIRLRGAGHIRHHESDRIASTAAALGALGGRVQCHADGLTIYPAPLHGGAVPTFDDHRIAMAVAVLAGRVPGVRILAPSCVSKTCPAFFDLLAEAGVTSSFS